MSVSVWILGLGFVVAGSAATAQEKEAPAATSTVTGRVLFADTNGPARFAKVLLKSVIAADPAKSIFSDEEDDDDDAKGAARPKPAAKKLTPEEEAQKKSAEQASMAMMAALGDLMVSTTVAVDGTYTFTNVKPGTYYVHAMAPGYIDPLAAFTSEQLTSKDPAMRAKIAVVATPIVVTGAEGGHADLRLDRGAAISGRVLYDDGTPAVGWTVRPVHPAPAGAAMPDMFSAMGADASDLDLTHISEVSKTDDTGYFRVAGLAAGDYVLQARLTAGALGQSSLNPMGGGGGGFARMMGIKLTVYSGNAIRQADAKSIAVRAGEERTGYDMQEPLHTLHSIGGMVRAKADGHPVNTGTVQLTLQDAQGKDDPSTRWSAGVGPDGTFRVDYVPGPATYSVKVSGAADSTTISTSKILFSTIAKTKTNKSYGPASSVVTLGDGDVLDVKLDVSEIPVAK